MASRLAKPHIVVIALLGLTSLALAFGVDTSLTDQAGVRVQLPAQLDSWLGDEILFCQNKTCQAQFFLSALTNRDTCPTCGGKLDSLSKIERDILPADTQGVKKRYTTAGNRQVMASIVLSGKERASIHRPEVCLQGQGSSIVNTEIIDVPIAGRQPLRVRVLELVHERTAENGSVNVFTSYYAYWFVGKDRETPSHVQRMWWMATDRILHNLAHRWAYIAVAGVRKNGSKDYQSEIRDVISKLEPAISIK